MRPFAPHTLIVAALLLSTTLCLCHAVESNNAEVSSAMQRDDPSAVDVTMDSQTKVIPVAVVIAAKNVHTAYKASKVLRTAVKAYAVHKAIDSVKTAHKCVKKGDKGACVKTAAEIVVKTTGSPLLAAANAAHDAYSLGNSVRRKIASARDAKQNKGSNTGKIVKANIVAVKSGRDGASKAKALSTISNGAGLKSKKSESSTKTKPTASKQVQAAAIVKPQAKKSSGIVCGQDKVKWGSKCVTAEHGDKKAGKQAAKKVRKASQKAGTKAPKKVPKVCSEGNVKWGSKCIKVESKDMMKVIKKCGQGKVKWGSKCVTAEHGDKKASKKVSKKARKSFRKASKKVSKKARKASRNIRISRPRISRFASRRTRSSPRFSRSIRTRRVVFSSAKAGIYLKVVISALEQSGYDADDFDAEDIYDDLGL